MTELSADYRAPATYRPKHEVRGGVPPLPQPLSHWRHGTASAKESAPFLLARSITFGQGRLAVVRLATAVPAGAEVPPAQWHCRRKAASRCKDDALRTLIADAR